MKIKPLGERVLVKPIEQEQKSAIILVPDTAKEKPVTGEVIAIGTDREALSALCIGQIILFGKYAGEEVTLNKEKHLVVNMADILAIVEE